MIIHKVVINSPQPYGIYVSDIGGPCYSPTPHTYVTLVSENSIVIQILDMLTEVCKVPGTERVKLHKIIHLCCVFLASRCIRKSIRTIIAFSFRTLVYVYPIIVHLHDRNASQRRVLNVTKLRVPRIQIS